MTTKTIIGIDPGAGGALAFITPDGRAVVHKTKTTLPLEAIQDALCGRDRSQVIAYIEELTGFQQGRVAMRGAQVAVMMRNLGVWEGILMGMGISHRLVKPQQWQAGISGVKGSEYADKKKALRLEAARRFPSMKPTADTADALLIADFGRRVES